MLKGKYLRSYRKEGSTAPTHVFAVSGSKSELEAYVAAQVNESGENVARFQDDDKTKAPLFFTGQQAHGKEILLGISQKTGRVFVDTTETDKLIGVAEQYKGSAVGAALANMAAEKIMANMLGTASITPVATPAKAEASAEKLGEQ